VKKNSLRVTWLGDRPTQSTLNGDWRSIVHRSKEKCLDAMKILQQRP
jgi:hypothetical protein